MAKCTKLYVVGLPAPDACLRRTLPMSTSTYDDEAGALFRPHGGGLPRKGKGTPRKKKVPLAQPTEVASPAAAPEASSNTVEQVVLAAEPPAPPPRKPAPIFATPAADDEVWSEVLTEVAPLRPPSVPVRITFTESKELPHWHEMPLETPCVVTAPPLEELGPQHFIAKEDAELLPDWFQDMERPYLEAAARDAVKGLKQHVVLALAAEHMAGRTRHLAMVARKVLTASGVLLGYEYPKAGPEQKMAILPWTQQMPTDKRNDTVRRIEFLGRRLQRLAL